MTFAPKTLSPHVQAVLDTLVAAESHMTAAQSRWWYSAHEALKQWRQAVRAMEAADAAMSKEGKQ